jgi:hypothetical protein
LFNNLGHNTKWVAKTNELLPKVVGEKLPLLDEIAREGARRRLIEALKAAVNDYVERHRSERDGQGHVLVMRNGRVRTRQLRLGAGTVELNARPIDERPVSISTTTIVSIWSRVAMGYGPFLQVEVAHMSSAWLRQQNFKLRHAG